MSGWFPEPVGIGCWFGFDHLLRVSSGQLVDIGCQVCFSNLVGICCKQLVDNWVGVGCLVIG